MDQNSGVHGNRKPPLTYNGKNDVSTFWMFFFFFFFFFFFLNLSFKIAMSRQFFKRIPSFKIHIVMSGHRVSSEVYLLVNLSSKCMLPLFFHFIFGRDEEEDQ